MRVAPIRRISEDLELSVEELKTEVVNKIELEMNNSVNTRRYIADKYRQLCDRLQSVSELNSTMSSLRGELRNVERAVSELQQRVDTLENKVYNQSNYSQSNY